MIDRPLSPEVRRRKPRVGGVPIALADGNEWLLAHAGLFRGLDALRDELYDDIQLSGHVKIDDLLWGAFALLAVNYDVDLEEIELLFVAVPVESISDAVTEALYGPLRPRKTYSGWARASLWCNGIDPDKVPSADVPNILDFLVETRRTVPIGEYCDSVEAASKIDAARQMAREQAARLVTGFGA